MKNMKEMRCPYCGRFVKLRKGSELFGPNARIKKVYVCSNYPVCDAYVSADSKGKPMGTLANKGLRELRVQAHKSFDRLWRSGYMTREWAYKWLSVRLGINERHCHIGQFGEERCEETIELCNSVWEKYAKGKGISIC